ncbi:MAG: NADP-dependent malic enzyme [Caldilineae bacterium]|nr:MAG: NADP-dependent malic enzyme [Caldilineae bacterium]
MSLKEEALQYHTQGRPGKIEVTPTKPLLTQHDLSLAYTPGVAQPVLEIAQDPANAFKYTAKGNLVAVLSNGSAILGLGNRGALASKPVMEGKGVLFKRFADVDVFDIEVDTQDPDEIIRVGQLIAPTFGGINLEDIKAPECFYIEEELERTTDIPIFHDDQHGTAIISGGALLNALELNGKKIDEITIVINGAGAAGIACGEFYVALGARRENIIMCDSRGVIYKGRKEGMNKYKERFASDTDKRTLAEAMVGADVFIGVSIANVVTQDMVRSMADSPIIFAMANPDPEITWEDACAARPDVIMATGRSDYPNQVNNVLGFPFIFRGALDVHATNINMEMKVAAAKALAELAHEDVPDSVLKAYGLDSLSFGKEYIIPKPLDPRVLTHVAPAVARAAIETGVARKIIDLDAYPDELAARQGLGSSVMQRVIRKAQKDPRRVVMAEGRDPRVIRAAYALEQQGIAKPILLGRPESIHNTLKDLQLNYKPTIVYPSRSPDRDRYAEKLHELRARKGVTRAYAYQLARNHNYFGPLMVLAGDADAFVSGINYHYPDVLRPALQVIGTSEDVHVISGVFIMVVRDRVYFFSDATVNPDPTAEQLAEIAISTAELAKTFDVEPRIAMISFSNFGSARFPQSEKVRQATELVRQLRPDLQIDGEMQADTAVTPELVEEQFPFSRVKDANVLIFPNLDATNAAYKLLARLGGAEAVGPILVGMAKPIHVLPTGAEVRDIVNIAALAVVDAQQNQNKA